MAVLKKRNTNVFGPLRKKIIFIMVSDNISFT